MGVYSLCWGLLYHEIGMALTYNKDFCTHTYSPDLKGDSRITLRSHTNTHLTTTQRRQVNYDRQQRLPPTTTTTTERRWLPTTTTTTNNDNYYRRRQLLPTTTTTMTTRQRKANNRGFHQSVFTRTHKRITNEHIHMSHTFMQQQTTGDQSGTHTVHTRIGAS